MPRKNRKPSSPVKGRGKLATARAVRHARRVMVQHKCLELRIQGLSERAIAEQLVKDGVVKKISRQSVNELLAAALDQIIVPEAEKLKKMELQRLDDLINGHYANAVNGDVGATHAVLACVDRRTRLLGIGQETKMSTQQLGADGKPIDPIRPVIHLTIAQTGGDGAAVIDSMPELVKLPAKANGHTD
jgi:hypothetical protein